MGTCMSLKREMIEKNKGFNWRLFLFMVLSFGFIGGLMVGCKPSEPKPITETERQYLETVDLEKRVIIESCVKRNRYSFSRCVTRAIRITTCQ